MKIEGNLAETLFRSNLAKAEGSKNELELMPVFLEQSRLSTFYQDNPWDVLTFTQQFGLPTMGGQINMDEGPGHRPENTYRNYLKQKENFTNEQFGNEAAEVNLEEDAEVTSPEEDKSLIYIFGGITIFTIILFLVIYRNEIMRKVFKH